MIAHPGLYPSNHQPLHRLGKRLHACGARDEVYIYTKENIKYASYATCDNEGVDFDNYM